MSGFIDQGVFEEAFRWRNELDEIGKTGKLDILIHSPGGDLSACYRIARFFSRHADEWVALVPEMAASGATLMTLGSSAIVMSECAQLGPIDPQVISKGADKMFANERQSPLEAFQALKYLRSFALTSLDATMAFLISRMVAPRRALETAQTLASHLAQPILSKIEPYDIGAFALDSQLSLSYCERVANPNDPSKKTQRDVRHKDLVEKYPAHEFSIDYEEARALKYNVSLAPKDLEEIFDDVRDALGRVREFVGFAAVKES